MITMGGLASRRGWIGLVGGIGISVAFLAAAGQAWFGPSIDRARAEYKIMPFTSFTDHHIRVHRPVEAADTPRGRP